MQRGSLNLLLNAWKHKNQALSWGFSFLKGQLKVVQAELSRRLRISNVILQVAKLGDLRRNRSTLNYQKSVKHCPQLKQTGSVEEGQWGGGLSNPSEEPQWGAGKLKTIHVEWWGAQQPICAPAQLKPSGKAFAVHWLGYAFSHVSWTTAPIIPWQHEDNGFCISTPGRQRC